ncbi:MAG: hypothetical protein K0R93_1997 [Anaerosolibacter sp.]|jgi:two-component system LytT family response regulator|uniref:LytR/AlgR family response regulator transcription factor n=1 Tax=Anaerosolibacter sp. TaxID=1872527 RepID=UPI002618296F|nr:LytTR family DNA-binding domain-containing protein [Anaerosolibacter sp.]MDF2547099.1 hypothetical protein [Anaerosolibacter sp.]
MILRTLIVDDQMEMRKIMKQILDEVPYVKVVGEAKNGLELLDFSLELSPDIIFIDIEIPGINGIEAAKEIRKRDPDVHLVFATGYRDYAGEAFDVYATDYIQKPYSRERIMQTLDRVKSLMKKEKNDEEKLVSILSNRTKRYIKLGDILFIESRNRKIYVFTAQEEIECNETLNEIYDLLDQRFMRTHKSFIVNLDRIRCVKPMTRTSYSVYFDAIEQTACVSKDLLEEMVERAENMSKR